ncbi:hypothetical protein C5167_013551 [Papaver somniferum]|uniref:Uncharacterized protein n=1 Tax=Papaver somniferum TaxID=3469 RepID=A0A4Y7J3P1_PAPSO|nr:uncharacterized acetyltransferase At3g50280-like [Papaver somniferum]RZC54690.1 hypothetical protein C5167_013551 [Papaver somniferum]
MACQDQVHHISTSIVAPASYNGSATTTTTHRRIDLTTWDLQLLVPAYIQRGLLFTKPKLGDSETICNIISNLKTSLSQKLDHFYPLAGRLAIDRHDDDGTTSVYINCNSTGAELIHAVAEHITVADILEPIYVPSLVESSFFSLNGVMNYDGLVKPLLSVQVTELNDGIFIGCSMNHVVCDGTSFWHFMNSWSEISRSAVGGKSSIRTISRLPILERCFLNNADCPIRLPFSIDDERFRESHVFPTIRYEYEVRFYHFTRETVAMFKAKADADIGPTNGRCISSLQALLAHFWVAVTRARNLDPNAETSYCILVGNRTRLVPPLPQEYFGNSVNFYVATTKVGELLEKGHGWGALLLNQGIMSRDDAAIRRSWDSWVQKPAFPDRAAIFQGTTLLSGGSPRFDMYGNDFGWGKPIAVRSGMANKSDGKISVIPGLVEGSLCVEACLSPKTLMAMENETEFVNTISI